MGTCAMGLFFLMTFSREENGKTKICSRRDVHFKYVIVNTIKYDLLFNLDILHTEIFKCVSGSVNSVLYLEL